MYRLTPLAIFVLASIMAACSGETPLAEETTQSNKAASLSVEVEHSSNGVVKWLPDPNCAVIDAFGDFHLTPCRNQFATYSEKGNAMVMTKASGVPNPFGRMVRWDAYNPPQLMLDFWGLDEPPAPCFLLDTNGDPVFTVKWWGTVSASGEAIFTCIYAKQWEFEWPD